MNMECLTFEVSHLPAMKIMHLKMSAARKFLCQVLNWHTNSVDPDQTAPLDQTAKGAVSSGSMRFTTETF